VCQVRTRVPLQRREALHDKLGKAVQAGVARCDALQRQLRIVVVVVVVGVFVNVAPSCAQACQTLKEIDTDTVPIKSYYLHSNCYIASGSELIPSTGRLLSCV
jgi:hypothetical protein